jgi:vesicle transport through interaction with t-SNAREs protein 1
MSNTERLDRTSTRLQDGHRTALETQEVAIGIMDNLNEQRETIGRSRGRVSK